MQKDEKARLKKNAETFHFMFISVADPGSGAFLTPGSGIWDLGSEMGKKLKIRIRDEYAGTYFRELRNNFLGYKCLNSLMRIPDPEYF